MTLPTAQWRPLIDLAGEAADVPSEVLEALVQIESGGNPHSRSPSDARGLCQLIPRWHADGVGKRVAELLGKPLTDDLWYDPEFSLRCGALHLRWCYDTCSHSWESAMAKYLSGECAKPDDWTDALGTTTNEYVRRFRAALNQVRQDKEPAMAKYTTVIPGLPGGPLVTDYPITINLVPKSHTRQRPGIKARSPRYSVQHGSGNPNSTAEGEIAYIVNGAEGRQASYHASADWDSVAIGIPADEVTWQAADGSGPGNMNGFSCELAENTAAWANPVKRAAMIRICGDFMGRVAARLAITKPNYHWDFNYMLSAADRHRCPDFLLFRAGHDAARTAYEQQYQLARADELARMQQGGGVVDVTVFLSGDTIITSARLNLRTGAGTSQSIITTLDLGATGTVLDGPRDANGYQWYQLDTPTGRGWVASEWLVKTGHIDLAAKPAPIPALLKTDLAKNDTAEGIVSDDNGVDFVFVADVIEVTAPEGIDAYQYADRKTVLRHYHQGDRLVVAWLFRYGDVPVDPDDHTDWMYVTPAPEWERIPFVGTIRISDAPLIPGEEHQAA